MRNPTIAICWLASGILMVQGPVLAQHGGGGHAGNGGFGGGGFHGGSIGNVGHVNNPRYRPGGYGYAYDMGETTFAGDGDLNAGGGSAAPVAGTGTGGGPPEKLQDGTGVYVPHGAIDPGGANWDSDWWARDPRSEAQQDARSAAVGASIGTVIPSLPRGYDTLYVPNARYYFIEGIFYQEADSGYQAVEAPMGIEVKQVPRDAEMIEVKSQPYFVYNDVYYQALYSGSGIIYKVVEDPNS